MHVLLPTGCQYAVAPAASSRAPGPLGPARGPRTGLLRCHVGGQLLGLGPKALLQPHGESGLSLKRG